MIYNDKTFHCVNIRVIILSQVVPGFDLMYQKQLKPLPSWLELSPAEWRDVDYLTRPTDVHCPAPAHHQSHRRWLIYTAILQGQYVNNTPVGRCVHPSLCT